MWNYYFYDHAILNLGRSWEHGSTDGALTKGRQRSKPDRFRHNNNSSNDKSTRTKLNSLLRIKQKRSKRSKSNKWQQQNSNIRCAPENFRIERNSRTGPKNKRVTQTRKKLKTQARTSKPTLFPRDFTEHNCHRVGIVPRRSLRWRNLAGEARSSRQGSQVATSQWARYLGANPIKLLLKHSTHSQTWNIFTQTSTWKRSEHTYKRYLGVIHKWRHANLEIF